MPILIFIGALSGLSGVSALSGETGGDAVDILYLIDGNPVFLLDGNYAYHV